MDLSIYDCVHLGDVKFFSRSFFKLFTLILGEGNKLAHCLARHAINDFSFAVWMESVPPFSFDVFKLT